MSIVIRDEQFSNIDAGRIRASVLDTDWSMLYSLTVLSEVQSFIEAAPNWVVSVMLTEMRELSLERSQLNFVTEFLYQRYFVFGDSIDTAAKEK